jgi:hypothetical protein
MRKRLVAVFATAMALASAGCLIVVSDYDPVNASGKRSVIEVDGEWYAVDVESKTVEKVESGRSVRIDIGGDD